MKIRAVLVGLSLLMFIFCSVGLSQAAVSTKYSTHFPPVNEHPWQESGSPPSGDTMCPNASSPIFIIGIGPVKLIIIRPFKGKSVSNENQLVDDWSNGKAPR